MGFLDGGAGVAAPLPDVAREQFLAKVHVAEQPVERLGFGMIGRLREELRGAIVPLARRRDGQVFLAGEMVEEAALGDAGGGTDVFDTRGGVAIGAHQVDGGGQQAGSGILGSLGHASPYQRVWRTIPAST